MTKRRRPNPKLEGELWLGDSNRSAFAAEQVQLLTAVEQCGSISKAAKLVGISYKTAWDRIDSLNNLSDRPRPPGGAQGGGTVVTDYGRQIIDGFQALEQEHREFLERLSNKVHSLRDVAHFMKVGTFNTSARNQFSGEISAIDTGAVNTAVILQITESQAITAVITEESRKQMKLEVGNRAVALIKASWVLLSTDTQPAISARNKLTGTILRIDTGTVNSDVVVDLGAGKSISAMITNTSIKELDLQKGQKVCAFFKASSVILMAE